MKLLYIGDKQISVKDGWDQVNKRNQVVVERLFAKVTYIPLDNISLSHYFNFSITNKVISETLSELTKGYDYVFVCQSLCGRICKVIKRHFPNIRIITFFHNIEKQYAKEFCKVSGLRAIPYYLRVLIWEKMAVQYSDYCITLNDRDSTLLHELYGKTADAVMPTSLEDKYDLAPKINGIPIDYLFVGTAFYPNIEGVQWFINHVLPLVDGRFCVVGKDMSPDIFNNLSDRVEIYGFVNDLSDYYKRARIIVSPIFHGGGMKTKTAEALMYGKYIIATDEALEGYKFEQSCMARCNTVSEFVAAINDFKDDNSQIIPSARQLFQDLYSYCLLYTSPSPRDCS